MSRAWLAPIGLFLLQAAPIGVVPDTTGRYRFAFGGDLGSVLNQTTDCYGAVTEQRTSIKSVGGEGEVWLSNTFHLTANAGEVWSSPVVAGGFSGGFVGVQLVSEDKNIGGGLGVEKQPSKGNEWTTLPLGYLRLGSRDNFHFRAEIGGPAAPGAPPDIFRIGFADHWGRTRQVGWRFDLGFSEFPDRLSLPTESYQVQMRFPIQPQMDLLALAQLRPAAGGNIGIAGRWTFGKPK